jgi:RNA polymerase sigma-70 factor (ECF subfamily)
LLDQKLFQRANPAKGRFRNYLLSAMEHFISNEWKKAQAQKRGGGMAAVPIQLNEAETRYGVEPIDDRTPEQAFEYNWALALLDEVMRKLEAEYCQRCQERLFAALKPAIVAAPDSDAVMDLTSKLEMSEGAIRVAVHRLRCRYRELLREEIGTTVDSPAEVDAEMRHLFRVLSRQTK